MILVIDRILIIKNPLLKMMIMVDRIIFKGIKTNFIVIIGFIANYIIIEDNYFDLYNLIYKMYII